MDWQQAIIVGACFISAYVIGRMVDRWIKKKKDEYLSKPWD